MKILETERLVLREVGESDGAFILELLNEPKFIQFIGDRNVRTLQAAQEYIRSRFAESYRRFNFGMWLIELKNNQTPIGICGFVRRDSLPDADIGFALLSRFEKKGFAFESAEAVMRYGRNVLKLKQILAITSQNNADSSDLLEKLGFHFERLVKISGDEDELKLFVCS